MTASVLSRMFRRRARRSAADTCARVSFAALADSGAFASSSSASGAPRSSKVPSAVGKYSRSWCRSRCTCQTEPGRDILVLNSAKLIQSMLAANLVDDLRLAVVPVLPGGGLHPLPDGVSSAWDLASVTTLPDGALGVHYQRR
jgi:hypothetical protein